jgi:hypothetical protein
VTEDADEDDLDFVVPGEVVFGDDDGSDGGEADLALPRAPVAAAPPARPPASAPLAPPDDDEDELPVERLPDDFLEDSDVENAGDKQVSTSGGRPGGPRELDTPALAVEGKPALSEAARAAIAMTMQSLGQEVRGLDDGVEARGEKKHKPKKHKDRGGEGEGGKKDRKHKSKHESRGRHKSSKPPAANSEMRFEPLEDDDAVDF